MNILFNLLIFSIPIGALVRYSPTPGVSVYPYDIFAGLILIKLLYSVFIKREKIKHKKIAILFLLFIFIGFASLLIDFPRLTLTPFLISLAYLVRWLSYASIIFAVQFLSDSYKKRLLNSLVVAGSIFVLLGFLQYGFYPGLSNLLYLGWDSHMYRLFSTMLDPNYAGIFLVLFLVLVTEFLVQMKKNNRTISYTLLFIWIGTLIAIILTYSRSAFIALLVSIFAVLSLHRMYRHAGIAVICFIILFLIFSNRTIESFSKRPFEGSNPFRIVSAEARITSTYEALKIISKNPVFGVGFDAYRFAQNWYGTRSGPNMMKSHADAGTDNSYLLVLATTGIIGFIVFADFLINILKTLYKNTNSSDIFPKVAFASLVGLMVDTIFINSLFYAPIMAWIFTIVGLGLLSSSNLNKKPDVKESR